MKQTELNDFSLTAYIELRDSGKLDANETIVLDEIKKHPCGTTYRELCKTLGWGSHRITSRITGLIEKDQIVVLGGTPSMVTGRSNTVYASWEFYPDLRGNAKRLLMEKRSRRALKILNEFKVGEATASFPPSVFCSPTAYNSEVSQ